MDAIVQEEARLLGSRRLYRLVRKGTANLERPVQRKNHPGETIQQNFHSK